jgi:Fe2+ or Zn2+ uptake regulation protein
MDLIDLLRSAGLQPTPQRLAVARYVLATHAHPTADAVLGEARKECPTLSRATVYNTLTRLVEKGMVKPRVIREGVVVFEPHTEKHHHLIDEETGEIVDVPWGAMRVSRHAAVPEYEVTEYQVVMRGRKRRV